MMRFRLGFLIAILLVACGGVCAEQEAAPSEFKEVYDLLREHLPGASPSELDTKAIKGLVTELAPKVMLLSREGPGSGSAAALLTRTTNFESIAYLRVAEVSPGLDKSIRQAFTQLGQKHKLKGMVLDLRFAGGDNYEAAGEAADLFVPTERVLLDAGAGAVKSRSKDDAITVPVAVLVNRDTKGSAEVLAAVLRETGSALILGSPTAGQALVWKDYPLKNGERLRIATGRVQAGSSEMLGADGVKPDLVVQVAPAEERLYYADSFRVLSPTNRPPGAIAANLSGSGTNVIRRPRNEAELVREKKEGITDPDSALAARVEPERPLVTDPALGRALDLLKGLAVVRSPDESRFRR